MSGTVSCPAPGSKHVHYLFEGTWDGPDGKLPPREILRGWTLRAIFWKA
jgi:hypothetical protein